MTIDKIERDVEAILKSFYRSALATGEIDVEGLSPVEIRAKCNQYLLKVMELNGNKIALITNHKQDLLEQAVSFVQEESYEYAVVFYALYLEHWINELYSSIFTQQGLSNADYKEMVRSLNMRAKTGWFLQLVNLPALDKTNLDVFNKIIELRNSFVHYKWQASETLSKDDIDFIEVIKSADELIKYLHAYEINNVYQGFDGFHPEKI